MSNEETTKRNSVVIRVVKHEAEGYFVETRRVDRQGMNFPVEYELKVPLTIAKAIEFSGETLVLQGYIQTLKTRSDDSVAANGRPQTAEQELRSSLKGMDDIMKSALAKLAKKQIMLLTAAEKAALGL